MVSITPWMEEFTAAVRAAFGERVYCIGLQGSYEARARLARTATSTWWSSWINSAPGHQGLPVPFSRPPPPGRGLRVSLRQRGAAGLGTLRPLPVLTTTPPRSGEPR